MFHVDFSPFDGLPIVVEVDFDQKNNEYYDYGCYYEGSNASELVVTVLKHVWIVVVSEGKMVHEICYISPKLSSPTKQPSLIASKVLCINSMLIYQT